MIVCLWGCVLALDIWTSPLLLNKILNFSYPLHLQVSVLVLAHTRELAFQISKEYERFSKYNNNIKIAVFFGGMNIKKDEEVLSKNCPHIVVATPGRLLALVRSKSLSLKNVKHFILDECDKMLAALGELLRESHYHLWSPF